MGLFGGKSRSAGIGSYKKTKSIASPEGIDFAGNRRFYTMPPERKKEHLPDDFQEEIEAEDLSDLSHLSVEKFLITRQNSSHGSPPLIIKR